MANHRSRETPFMGLLYLKKYEVNADSRRVELDATDIDVSRSISDLTCDVSLATHTITFIFEIVYINYRYLHNICCIEYEPSKITKNIKYCALRWRIKYFTSKCYTKFCVIN